MSWLCILQCLQLLLAGLTLQTIIQLRIYVVWFQNLTIPLFIYEHAMVASDNSILTLLSAWLSMAWLGDILVMLYHYSKAISITVRLHYHDINNCYSGNDWKTFHRITLY